MKFKRNLLLRLFLKEEALEIAGLRVVFSIKKTRDKKKNESEIKIYNLSETTRAKIKKEGDNVELLVGYGEDLELIFKGDIRQIVHLREGAEIVTIIGAVDGDSALRNSVVNVTTKGGTTLKEYVTLLAKKLEDIKIGKIVGLDGLVGNKTATTFFGDVKKELDRLSLKYDFEYTIENHVFNAVRNNATMGKCTLISPQTGMLDTPSAKEEYRVSVKTLLDNTLFCNSVFTLESEFIKRDFRIDEIEYRGDTHGNDWYCVIEAIDLDAKKTVEKKKATKRKKETKKNEH